MAGVFQFAHTWGVLTGGGSPINDTIRRTLAGSHQPMFEARVVHDFQIGGDPDGVPLDIHGGSVDMDGTADIQRSLDLTVTGAPFPRRVGDLLLPDGAEVFVRRGIDLGETTIWAPLGYFRIEDDDQDDAPDGQIRITGYDRMAGIIDADLLTPQAFEPDTTIGQVFRSLVEGVYPDAVVVFDDIDVDHEPIGRLLVVERSRYEPLRTLAAGRGKTMNFDGSGIMQVYTAPDPEDPAWEVRAGRGGVATRVRRRVTRAEVVNAVVVRSQGGDTQGPARAVAVDAGPHSPTRFGGRFGRVPAHVTMPAVSSGPQAAQAATDNLRRMAGLPFVVEFGAVPNPWLVPFDPIRVTLRDGTREKHVVESLSIPLVAAAQMRGTTREQRRARIKVVSATSEQIIGQLG